MIVSNTISSGNDGEHAINKVRANGVTKMLKMVKSLSWIKLA